MGAGFPESPVSVPRMQNAAPSRQEKSLVSASTHKSLAFADVATAMRRLFGPCGGAARQDISAAEYANKSLGSDMDQEACAANRKAENGIWGGERRAGRRKRAGARERER